MITTTAAITRTIARPDRLQGVLRRWYFPIGLAVFLIATAQLSFLVFHTLAELFAVIVCFTIFALAWFTHRFSQDHFLLYLACGLFWIGGLDIFHTLAYKGMGQLPVHEANTATQVWVVARFLQALLLLSAPLVIRRAPDRNLLFLNFGLIAVVVLLWVTSGHFPDAFLEGQGLTRFKIFSEYVIMTILAAAGLLMWRRRADIAPDARVYLLLAIIFAIGTELAFTLYVDVYGISNMVGHILKIFSFWAILQAVAVANLIRPYRELAASNRAKDDFFASMSHDLRTPLNSILGYSDMIRGGVLGPLGHRQHAEYVANIHASGTLLLSLVNDILDLSKLESGNYALNIRPLDPRALSDEVLRGFMPAVASRNLKVTVDCSGDVPQILADERAMVQLLNNLLSNAVKFSRDGGEVGVSWSRQPGSGVALRVSDTGCGIPADQIASIGRPYIQVDPYVTRQHGSGLGLAIARRIARLHGADLRIESELGRGTAVTVAFPEMACAGSS